MATTIAPAPNDAPNAMPATDAGRLIERADALAQVNAWIREAQENGDVDEGRIPDYLEELLAIAELDLRTKLERTAAVYRRKGTEIAVIDAMLEEAKKEVARLAGRKQSRVNEQERIKTYARTCLEIAGETKVETPIATIRIQRNGGSPSIAWTGAPDALPEAFRRPPAPPALDVEKARAHFKTHDTLPEGFAVTMPGFSLRIV